MGMEPTAVITNGHTRGSIRVQEKGGEMGLSEDEIIEHD